MPTQYHVSERDGYRSRKGGLYVKLKLGALSDYINIFTTAMSKKAWSSLNYVDLLSGPGEIYIEESRQYLDGSPILALNADPKFDNLWFVEKVKVNFQPLEKRCSVIDINSRANCIHGDCNEKVTEIVETIDKLDQQYRMESRAPSLNLAFLDPDGCKTLQWSTIERLASIKHMDLIINYSTSTVLRTIKLQSEADNVTVLDEFFGGYDWRDFYKDIVGRHGSNDHLLIGRKMLNFYKSNLKQLGYHFVFDDPSLEDFAIKNSKESHMYTLIGTGKHELAVRFWSKSFKGAFKRITEQPELPGFVKSI